MGQSSPICRARFIMKSLSQANIYFLLSILYTDSGFIALTIPCIASMSIKIHLALATGTDHPFRQLLRLRILPVFTRCLVSKWWALEKRVRYATYGQSLKVSSRASYT